MTTIEVRADRSCTRWPPRWQDLAREAQQIGRDLSGTPAVGRDLQATVEGFLGDHRTAAAALAGELQWLGDDDRRRRELLGCGWTTSCWPPSAGRSAG